jgi:hypothetical protein
MSTPTDPAQYLGEMPAWSRQASNHIHYDADQMRDYALDAVQRALAAQQQELQECEELREKLSDLLRRTAVALRGPEPPLTRWSWHDLPERAAAAIAAIDVMQRAAVAVAQQEPGK